MNEINELPYYPRFIFNISNGNCFSTADLEVLNNIKEKGRKGKINNFKKGQIISISEINENAENIVKTYKVLEIEIGEIKYEIDEKKYGINLNDCENSGKDKIWLMEIFIKLELIE
ncbi:hypothetical protein [Polaribacter sp. SA4-12]|uniref:hypothetical protein n=1 Tax=Polaribacter sp. SA4-12 TaxID=1312072 RepID=UPI000B3CD862|nr:hypothetical protein [Polaribacter sp. SA4-12]ARV15354.1 hypothetical protein BTO07_09465 [Polaribacter sp. SA4-12]